MDIDAAAPVILAPSPTLSELIVAALSYIWPLPVVISRPFFVLLYQFVILLNSVSPSVLSVSKNPKNSP